MKSRDVQSEEEERFDTGCVNINVTRSSLFCVGIARLPIPVAVRSKALFCGRSLTEFEITLRHITHGRTSPDE